MDADVEPENVTASARTSSSWETVDLQRNVRLRQATSSLQPASTTVVPPSAHEDSLRTEATGDHDDELSSRGFLGRGPAQENRDPVAFRKVNSNTYNSRSECGIIVCGNANFTIHHHADRDKLRSTGDQHRSEEDVGTQNRQQYGAPSRQPSPHQSANTAFYESLAETILPSDQNVDTRQDALHFTHGRLNIREHSAPTHVDEADERTCLKQPEHACPPMPSSLGDTSVFGDIHINAQVAGFSGNVSFSTAAHHTLSPSDSYQERTTAQCAKATGRTSAFVGPRTAVRGPTTADISPMAFCASGIRELNPEQVQTDYPKESEGECRILLIGKTGSGKSSTGNTILGSKKFKSSIMPGSETSECQLERATRKGVPLKVMDSLGLFDTTKSNREIIGRITKSLFCMSPGPNAIVYVIQIGRYTEEEFKTYKRLKEFLKDDANKHMIVLFTHGNKLVEENVSIEDYLKGATKELTQVMTECGNRYVVFDNKSENADQVDLFLQNIRKMIAESGVSHYSPDFTSMFNEANISEDKSKGLFEVLLNETTNPEEVDINQAGEHREEAGNSTLKSYRGHDRGESAEGNAMGMSCPAAEAQSAETCSGRQTNVKSAHKETDDCRVSNASQMKLLHQRVANAEEEVKKLRTENTELKQTSDKAVGKAPENVELQEVAQIVRILNRYQRTGRTTDGLDWAVMELISNLTWKQWLLIVGCIILVPLSYIAVGHYYPAFFSCLKSFIMSSM